MTINTDRLTTLDSITLKAGGHRTIDDGACVMELVAYIAGEPWTDHPACACPVLWSLEDALAGS